MSDRWEESLRKWYESSQIANLEYLDLANQQKVTNQDLAHNITVGIGKTIASSKYQASLIKKAEGKVVQLQQEVQRQGDLINQFSVEQKLHTKYIRQLEETILNQKPLTIDEVRSLVKEIAKQPKLVEKEAFRLTEDLRQQVAEVKKAVTDLKNFIAS